MMAPTMQASSLLLAVSFLVTVHCMPHNNSSANVSLSNLGSHLSKRHADLNTFNVLDFFLSYEETNEWLDALQAAYPDRVQVETIGASVEQRDIKSITINKDQRETVLITANVHAREWVTMTSAIYLIHELVRNADKYPELVWFRWIIVPVPNPDGYEYTRSQDRFWRKNRAPLPSGEFGVDLNRNFEFQWDVLMKDADADPAEETYRGPGPASEPETQALAELILYNNAAILYVDLHSYGQYIFYPWAYTDEPADNVEKARAVALAGQEGIARESNEQYAVGTPAVLIYKVSGSGMDYCHSVGIQACIAIELTGKQVGFEIDQNQIIPFAEEAMAGIRAMALKAGEP
uniref:Peptidase M14 domain-containing protein n=1 Tax=Anopheles atroparvus TaxID=41427 RepID=A0A182JKN6_ANOAO